METSRTRVLLVNIERAVLTEQVLSTESQNLPLQLHMATVPCFVDLATVTAPKACENIWRFLFCTAVKLLTT